MKKKYLLLGTLFLLFGVSSYADTDYYSFNGNLEGWTAIDADGDGFNWVHSSQLIGQGGCAMSQSYDFMAGPLAPDNYLVSPLTHINYEGSVSFSISMHEQTYSTDYFGVAISTTGNTDPADFTTIYESVLESSKAHGAWRKVKVDLSAYQGQDVYVAIRHFNVYDVYYIDVKDVYVASKSHPYHPLIHDTSVEQEWNVMCYYSMFSDKWTRQYWLGGEQEHEGKIYREVYSETLNNKDSLSRVNAGLIREEDGKVYQWLDDGYGDFLLYDFNMQVGDSIRLNEFDEEYLHLTGIYEDGFGDEARNMYVFDGDPYWGYEGADVWVEGVGSMNGLLDREQGLMGMGSELLCYYEDGERLWSWGGNCIVNTVSVAENEIQEMVDVYPNPTKGIVTIEIHKADKIVVYNSMGQIVNSLEVNRQAMKTEIDLTQHPNSIYFIQVTDKDGRSTMNRIVKSGDIN